jgi:predicted DsbA family dithiol-disulfide isomerase
MKPRHVIRVTFFAEVTSSWCYWAEPAWAEIKNRFADKAEFHWKIALLDAKSLPVSVEQLKWFYRRSGTIVRSPFMLNPGWYEQGVTEYLVANVVAEAAKDLGVSDDRVRLAISHAALREGRKVTDPEAVVAIAAKAGSLNPAQLMAASRHPDVEARIRASTAEFHNLRVTQRPTFVVENEIGDKAVLSGTWTAAPIAAVIESMLADQAAYLSWRAHVGTPPES